MDSIEQREQEETKRKRRQKNGITFKHTCIDLTILRFLLHNLKSIFVIITSESNIHAIDQNLYSNGMDCHKRPPMTEALLLLLPLSVFFFCLFTVRFFCLVIWSVLQFVLVFAIRTRHARAKYKEWLYYRFDFLLLIISFAFFQLLNRKKL